LWQNSLRWKSVTVARRSQEAGEDAQPNQQITVKWTGSRVELIFRSHSQRRVFNSV